MKNVVPLGDLVEVRGGGTPSRANPEYWNGDIPWATVKDFKSTVIDTTLERISLKGAENSATNIIPAGAVIVPTRMAIGKAAINKIDLAINQDLKALLPSDEVDSSFLLHFLLSQSVYLEGRAQGATVKGIKLELLRSLPFPRFSLEEQRRIAAILDKANSVREKQGYALAVADKLLRSAYIHIVGHLSRGYSSWQPYSIEQLAKQCKGSIRSGPFGSALLHSEFVDEGIAVLGIDNAVQNKFAWDERRFITKQKYEELRRYRVFPNDVIITIMGTTGRSAVVPNDVSEAITTKHLATITCNTSLIHPEVLSFAVHSDPMLIRQIQARNKGAIMDGLNLGIIRELTMNLPPMAEQERFVEILKATRRVTQRITGPIADGSDLLGSLSQRAFRGEL